MTVAGEVAGPFQYGIQLVVGANAPAAVAPHANFTATFPGGSRTLPTTNPYGVPIVAYSHVEVDYQVSGATIVPGSAVVTDPGSSNGAPLHPDVTTTDTTLAVSIADYVGPGASFIAPSVSVGVTSGNAGSTIGFTAAAASEWVHFYGGFGASTGTSQCPIGAAVGSVNVSSNATTTTGVPTTTVATTTLAPTTTTTAAKTTTTTTAPKTTTTTVAPTTTVPPTTVPPTTAPPTTIPPTSTTTTTTVPAGTVSQVSVSDAIVQEPASRSIDMAFTITISPPNGQASVKFATADRTAVAPGDYVAKTGIVKFSRGQTKATVNVSVKADNVVEPNEAFVLILSGASNCQIVDGVGIGTIVNR
jgi:hypothetical protein